jgi:hypothetical protein
MMPNELHNSTDLEQLIKDARYARMSFRLRLQFARTVMCFCHNGFVSRERKSLRAGEHGTSANQPRGESPQISCSVIE